MTARLDASVTPVEEIASLEPEMEDYLLVPTGVGRLGGIDVVDGPADATELEERSTWVRAHESSRGAGREGVQQAV